MADRTAGLRLVVAVTLAVAVGGAALSAVPSAPPAAGVTLAVDGERLVLTNRAGPTLDVRRLELVVRVDGTPLAHQPPVPFFAAVGFDPGPTGPFNAAADPTWERGERAAIRVADTNGPSVDAGDRVTVELRVDGRSVATVTATA